MNEPASSGNGQDFDVFSVMDWKDGIGTLPGSDLKFRVNEFGALEVITDETEMENVKKATATTTWMVPTAQEAFSEKTEVPPKLKETAAVDGLHFCESCFHSGTTMEFVAGEKSCSQKCAHPLKNKEQQENKNISEFSDEDCSKTMQKRKTKLPLKGEYMEDRDKKDKETVSILLLSNFSIPYILIPALMSKGKKMWSWSSYLEEEKAIAAPPKIFKEQSYTDTTHTQMVIPSGFRVGMKLEAVDKKNPTFICVATVTDIVDNRFLVHFDNWDESYDYWCEASSPYIHPVGWCKEHRRTLVTPPGYPHAKHFTWEKYLEETNSLPAPARAFKVKPPHGFQKNMRLEVVDKRNPVLIRVATVVDTDDHRIKVHFDGWDSIYDYWIDADSPDIHPAGWCGKTGHPLQPPLSPLELVEALEQGGCPTAGCKGIGHIKRARHMGHHSAVSCPYSEVNLNKEHIFSDRLSGGMPLNNPPTHWNRKDSLESPPAPQFKGLNPLALSLPYAWALILVRILFADSKESSNSSSQPVIWGLSSKLTIPAFPLRWEQQSKLLPTVAGIPASKVSKWSTDEVSEFIRSLPGCEEHGKVFKDEQIDGEAFLLMTQADIVKIMSIKLGPALKIFNSILMFKAADKSSHNEL
uniref:L3MBTL histone methyl-lysine binding protein 3 n=1 Tax=Varanus komodoensis TaxID=61221 RepID=A0A8D2L1X7_VARKO